MKSRPNNLRCLVAMIGTGFATHAIAAPDVSTDAVQAMRGRATECARRGDLAGELAQWRVVELACEKARDTAGQAEALLRVASVCQALGQFHVAEEALERAHALAQSSRDETLLQEVQTQRGFLYALSGSPDPAMLALTETLARAQARGDKSIAAVSLNGIGIALAVREERGLKSEINPASQPGAPLLPATSAEAFSRSADLAIESGDISAAVRALLNQAKALRSAGDARAVRATVARIEPLLRSIGDSHGKAMMLLTLAQIGEQTRVLSREDGTPWPTLVAIHGWCDEARRIAEACGDTLALTYAWGQTGRLYELQERYAESERLMRRAIAAAQSVQSPDALYRWQWQLGRVIRRQGDRDADAIAAYQSAALTLEGIRSDITLVSGLRNGRSVFREECGPLFLELTDLLLSGSHGSDEAIQSTLAQACGTVELLKSTELRDYFREECVQISRVKSLTRENIEKGTAVVYLIPLADRLEILVSIEGRITRYRNDSVNAAKLTEAADSFRKSLEIRTRRTYIAQAQQIYQWLIAPIRPDLEKAHVDTLVFVPDGALRTIPMAALHDGEDFLVRHYAIANAPGLELIDPKPIARQRISILASGISQARQNFPGLDGVEQEIEQIRSDFRGRFLLNDQFTRAAFEGAFSEESFSIVHIASHGQFSSVASESFVLTWDDKLRLDQLERLVRPSQFRGQPVELLTLSACETAAGDDRAALGLAGVAVKAGARSAVATLWLVNDQASLAVVTEFYSQLKTKPTLSKAKALQAAQLKVLDDPNDRRFRHPCYWSPYLLIGNWL